MLGDFTALVGSDGETYSRGGDWEEQPVSSEPEQGFAIGLLLVIDWP